MELEVFFEEGRDIPSAVIVAQTHFILAVVLRLYQLVA